MVDESGNAICPLRDRIEVKLSVSSIGTGQFEGTKTFTAAANTGQVFACRDLAHYSVKDLRVELKNQLLQVEQTEIPRLQTELMQLLVFVCGVFYLK